MKTEASGLSLLAACARVPDGRSRPGRRARVLALLTRATAALLAGARPRQAWPQPLLNVESPCFCAERPS